MKIFRVKLEWPIYLEVQRSKHLSALSLPYQSHEYLTLQAHRRKHVWNQICCDLNKNVGTKKFSYLTKKKGGRGFVWNISQMDTRKRQTCISCLHWSPTFWLDTGWVGEMGGWAKGSESRKAFSLTFIFLSVSGDIREHLSDGYRVEYKFKSHLFPR